MNLILRGAEIIDGTGSPGRRGDVRIVDGKIAEVGAVLPSASAADEEVLDLSGLTLAPGFIDLHTHLDAQILWDPDFTPSSWHGVTTTIIGNCGFGIAPTRPEHRSLVLKIFENTEAIAFSALEEGIEWTFETYPEYLEAIRRTPKRLNVGALVGHTPLRLYVMGEDATEREADSQELESMKELLREALRAGAIGFATSKNDVHVGAYGKRIPSRAASKDEFFELARVVDDADHGVITVTSGTQFSLDDIAELASQVKRPVSWESVMTGYDSLDSYGSAPPGTALATLRRSTSLGPNLWPQVSCRPVVMQVTLADPYPFISYCWSFKEVTAVPHDQRKSVYEDQSWRDRARADLGDRAEVMWMRMSVQETVHHQDIVGIPIGVLANRMGVDPLDLFIDLGLTDDLETRYCMVLMNDDEDELAQILLEGQFVLGGSDAGAHLSQLCDACYSSHLLGYWVRERNIMSLERAIWLLTGHTANIYGLGDRGRIAPGLVADLVAFDRDHISPLGLERVWDLPGGSDRLIARSIGVEHVWVNGIAIRRDGKEVPGAYPGQLVTNTSS